MHLSDICKQNVTPKILKLSRKNIHSSNTKILQLNMQLVIENPDFDTDVLQPNESKSPLADIESDDESEDFDENNVNVDDDSYVESIGNNDDADNDSSVLDSEPEVDVPEQNTDNIYNVDSDSVESNDEKEHGKKKSIDNDEDEIHDLRGYRIPSQQT